MKYFFRALCCMLVSLLFYTCKKEDVSAGQAELFVKYYGGALGSRGYDLKQTSDGGYVLVGTTSVEGKGTDAILVKTDAQGNQLWARTYGGTGNDEGRSIQIISSGYVFCGVYGNTADKDMYLVTTDINGAVQSGGEDIMGGAADQEANSIRVLPGDGGYVFCGSTTAGSTINPAGARDVLVVKTDAQGARIWPDWFTVGSSEDEMGNSIQVIDSNNFFILGSTGSYNLPGSLSDNRINVLALYVFGPAGPGGYAATPSSNYAVFGGSEDDNGSSSYMLPDNKFIITGNQGGELYISKLVANGIPYIDPSSSVWPKTFSAPGASRTIGKSIQSTTDGGYIVLATAEISGSNWDQYLTKRDANGNILWEHFFGGEGRDEAGAVIQTTDGGYAFVGTTEFGGVSMISLIKVTAEGVLKK